MLLRQLSYAIKNQLKAPKAPYLGLWDEMPPTRGISCLSLVLYGIRIGSEGHHSDYNIWRPGYTGWDGTAGGLRRHGE